MVSKRKLVNAVVKFIDNDLIPYVGDRNTKFVLAMAKDSLKENNDLADAFLHSPMVSTLVKEEDGDYDISQLSMIMKNVLSEYDSLPITIPKIPLFSPVEKVLKITSDDIEKLLKYVTQEE